MTIVKKLWEGEVTTAGARHTLRVVSVDEGDGDGPTLHFETLSRDRMGDKRWLSFRADENPFHLAALVGVILNDLDRLRAFKRSVDEALNSGDGSYRP